MWDCSRVLWDNEGTWAETTPRLQELRTLPEGTRLDIGSPFDLLNPLGSQRAEHPEQSARHPEHISRPITAAPGTASFSPQRTFDTVGTTPVLGPENSLASFVASAVLSETETVNL